MKIPRNWIRKYLLGCAVLVAGAFTLRFALCPPPHPGNER